MDRFTDRNVRGIAEVPKNKTERVFWVPKNSFWRYRLRFISPTGSAVIKITLLNSEDNFNQAGFLRGRGYAIVIHQHELNIQFVRLDAGVPLVIAGAAFSLGTTPTMLEVKREKNGRWIIKSNTTTILSCLEAKYLTCCRYSGFTKSPKFKLQDETTYNRPVF